MRRAPASLRVSTFCWASIWKRYSCPIRRAGSPVHDSASPEHHELTPASCSSWRHGAARSAGRLVVERSGAADPVEVLDVVGDVGRRRRRRATRHVEGERLGPLQARRRPAAPRVGRRARGCSSIGFGRLGEGRLHQHLVAAHVDDVVDVLDVDGALLHAGAAGRARPQHVVVDDAARAGGLVCRRAGARRRSPLPPRAGRTRARRCASSPSRASSAAVSHGPLASAWSRRVMISSLGDSGLSVFHAGHWLWQRPHSVQVPKSSSPFQVKSSTLPTPIRSSSPGSSKSTALPSECIGSSAPRARGRRAKATLGSESRMCRCLL